jgi:hypothetical protein
VAINTTMFLPWWPWPVTSDCTLFSPANEVISHITQLSLVHLRLFSWLTYRPANYLWCLTREQLSKGTESTPHSKRKLTKNLQTKNKELYAIKIWKISISPRLNHINQVKHGKGWQSKEINQYYYLHFKQHYNHIKEKSLEESILVKVSNRKETQ